MRIRSMLLVLALLAGCLTPQPRSRWPVQDDPYFRYVVAIDVPGGWGSGVIVHSSAERGTYVLTAGHVVAGGESYLPDDPSVRVIVPAIAHLDPIREDWATYEAEVIGSTLLTRREAEDSLTSLVGTFSMLAGSDMALIRLRTDRLFHAAKVHPGPALEVVGKECLLVPVVPRMYPHRKTATWDGEKARGGSGEKGNSGAPYFVGDTVVGLYVNDLLDSPTLADLQKFLRASPKTRFLVENPIRPHVIVVSIDGLRPEFYTDPAYDAPTLKSLAAEGVSAKAVQSVYPSFTWPAHVSLITGTRPGKHGVYDNQEFSAKGWGDFYFDAKKIRSPTLWQAAHRKGLRSAIVLWPVSAGAEVDWLIPETFDSDSLESTLKLLRTHSTPGLLDEVGISEKLENRLIINKDEVDELTASAVCHILEKYKPDLLFTHLLQVDSAQHRHGREHEEVRKAVHRVDAILARIREATKKVGLLDQTVFLVVGDHGFEDTPENLCPNDVLVKAGLIHLEEDDRLADWKALANPSGGSCAVYAKDHDSADRARKALEAASHQNGKRFYRILERVELDKLGYNPEASFALEAEEGYWFNANLTPPFIRRNPWLVAQHGHLPTRPNLATGFVASGAGIRKGVIDRMEIIDVAPTVATLLGLDLPDAEGRALPIRE